MISIKHRLYRFIIVVVLVIAAGSIVVSYLYNARQIEYIYKDITIANAKNFASTLDGDYLKELRETLESDEYRAVFDKAVAAEDESMIQTYLQSKGLWDKYIETRKAIDRYITNMETIKYVYIVAHGDENATVDMYMIDDSEQALYDAAGRWEDREDVYLGKDLTTVEPSISYSDEWGWLVSDFEPVYDSHGKCVCIVGCDVDYTSIANVKKESLIYSVLFVLLLSGVTILLSFRIISKYVINPLKAISNGIKDFNPARDTVDARILNLGFTRKDEIGEIYNSIRANQIQIVDYIRNITEMKEDLSEKDMKISKLSMESFKDALTSVGNKGAYLKKMSELNNSNGNYAIVMVDINDLKKINDVYGHKAGDSYIQGCCKLVCKAFRHSPIYRIGGDEFVVIAENQDYANRTMCLEMLKDAFIKSEQRQNAMPWEKLSASFGMAEHTSDDTSAEMVFKRADRAMYEEKEKFKETNGSYR